MFGYVRPRPEELRVREEAHYRAAYCGLCRCLGKRYGYVCRFLVNYDMTFLYLLLSGYEEPGKCEKHFCPANPAKRKSFVPITPAMEYTADICVILCALSLEDKRRDEQGLKRSAAALAGGALHAAYRKASERQPEFAAFAKAQLSALSELEAARCAEMDRAADAFAQLLSRCADPMLPSEKRPARQLLYHVGRYIYLTDALDDLEKDAESGNFNPILCRFYCQDGKLSPENREYVVQSILQSVSMARSALPLCGLRYNESIIDNITALGLPGVLCAVEKGVFQARRKMKATGEV